MLKFENKKQNVLTHCLSAAVLPNCHPHKWIDPMRRHRLHHHHYCLLVLGLSSWCYCGELKSYRELWDEENRYFASFWRKRVLLQFNAIMLLHASTAEISNLPIWIFIWKFQFVFTWWNKTVSMKNFVWGLNMAFTGLDWNRRRLYLLSSFSSFFASLLLLVGEWNCHWQIGLSVCCC